MKHILFLLLFIPLFSYAQPHTVITCENNKLILKREGSIVELTCYTYRVSANTIVIKDEYTYRITSQQVQRPIREVQSLIENCGCYTTSLGPAGADGLSAYQLAVEQGYPDSLEAWLASLNGDGFYWQGDWSDANEYESGVVVRGSDDNLYVCYDNHTSSSTTEPITGVSWATKWDLFLTKGEDGVIGSNGADGNDGLGFNYRQAFFLGDTIRVNDIVVGTNGNLYICYNEHESSNDSYPVTGVDHTLYYNLFLPKGAAGANGNDGADGLSLTWEGNYDNGTAYGFQEVVHYQGSSYICINNPSIGNLPTDTAYWDVVALKGLNGVNADSVWTENAGKIYYNTNNVGIGESNPESILSIKGDVFTKGGISIKDTNSSSNPRTVLRYDGTGDGAGDGFVPPFTISYNNAYGQNLPLDSNANYTAFIGFNEHTQVGSNKEYGTVGISMESHYDYGTELHLIHNYDSLTTGGTRFVTYKGYDDGSGNNLGLNSDVVAIGTNNSVPKLSVNTATNNVYFADSVTLVSQYEGQPFMLQKTGVSTRPLPYWSNTDTFNLAHGVTMTGVGGSVQLKHDIAFGFEAPNSNYFKNTSNAQVLSFEAPSNNRIHKLFAQSDGRMDWMVDPTGSNPLAALTIMSDKRIGVDNNSPNYKLHVIGTAGTVGLGLTGINTAGDAAQLVSGTTTGELFGYVSFLNATNGAIWNLANRSSNQYARAEVQIQNSSTSGTGQAYTRYMSNSSDWSLGTRRDNQSLSIVRSSGLDGTPDLSISNITGNVGLGLAEANASAILDMTSTSKGFLPPRMTAAQKDAIGSPATGLVIYQTDGTSGLYHYNGSAWATLQGSNGMNGTNGQGVPVGGTTNQVLSKIDGTDYNTTWSNPVAGANADMTRTSTSGETINFVAKSFAYTSSSNLGWGVGTRIRAFASVGNYIEGPITTVSATAVTFTPDVAVGSGTHFSWTLSIAGIKGDAGSNGSAGTTYVMETTSTTSNSISVASKTFNYSATSLGWAIGTRIRAYNDASNYMSGVITAVSGISVTLDISYIVGSGTYTAWTLSVTGDRGDTGATGLSMEITASIISSPSGTVTLARKNETFCSTTLTDAHTFTIALATPTSGYLNEYILSFKTGATLPSITQPASIKWRVAAPTLAINENWTFVYQNIEVSAGVYEIWASAVKAI